MSQKKILVPSVGQRVTSMLDISLGLYFWWPELGPEASLWKLLTASLGWEFIPTLSDLNFCSPDLTPKTKMHQNHPSQREQGVLSLLDWHCSGPWHQGGDVSSPGTSDQIEHSRKHSLGLAFSGTHTCAHTLVIPGGLLFSQCHLPPRWSLFLLLSPLSSFLCSSSFGNRVVHMFSSVSLEASRST